ncbi:hypothetical protein MPTK1_1g28870 [Marchantia polymorpha subsp. ruderalis]|uniref:Uncharacterized protein n=2 Tax=Marchantia polymorpha TaxID=3197 RepID=A0AAF6AVD0_MARPO|nr:hypothetical protein MARPO_0107s0004 [Marchantia polymorpha]BBN00401.1 hypothetical protein Mp_1g28870 [Marchantia polymorpha subsp. ruderalis]|eukprot:PTQ31727.1 hypothetical protein MARPO_0107s0004 [Marchantia polymorpha]
MEIDSVYFSEIRWTTIRSSKPCHDLSCFLVLYLPTYYAQIIPTCPRPFLCSPSAINFLRFASSPPRPSRTGSYDEPLDDGHAPYVREYRTFDVDEPSSESRNTVITSKFLNLRSLFPSFFVLLFAFVITLDLHYCIVQSAFSCCRSQPDAWRVSKSLGCTDVTTLCNKLA